jgi:hypothetical protein
MGLASFDTPYPSIISILEALQETGTPVPHGLLFAVQQLEGKILRALEEAEENLEPTLEAMFPEVWKLRISAMPFLAEVDLSAVFDTVETEIEEVASKIPALKGTVERLQFGLGLMIDFIEQDIPDYSLNVPSVVPEYQSIVTELSTSKSETTSTLLSLLQGSLMMELLLFALYQVAKGEAKPSPEMCYELQYLSGTSVKEYAIGIGATNVQFPWQQHQVSDFQSFLLKGPVASNEQIEFIKQKRAHFGLWE